MLQGQKTWKHFSTKTVPKKMKKEEEDDFGGMQRFGVTQPFHINLQELKESSSHYGGTKSDCFCLKSDSTFGKTTREHLVVEWW
jgi:hypothetical protein